MAIIGWSARWRIGINFLTNHPYQRCAISATGYTDSHPPPNALYNPTIANDTPVELSTHCCWVASNSPCTVRMLILIWIDSDAMLANILLTDVLAGLPPSRASPRRGQIRHRKTQRCIPQRFTVTRS